MVLASKLQFLFIVLTLASQSFSLAIATERRGSCQGMLSWFLVGSAKSSPTVSRDEVEKILTRHSRDIYERSFVSNGQIPDFAIIYGGAAERLLVLNQPNLDPVLWNWLATTKEAAMRIVDIKERAGFISRRVSKSFALTGKALTHPFRNIRHNQLTAHGLDEERDNFVTLGNFIANRTGDCRHQATLLQLAFQQSGIISSLTFGDIEEYFSNDRAEIYPSAWHAWVEAKIDSDQASILYDPAQALHGLEVDYRREISRKFWGTTISYYVQGNSALAGCAPLSKAVIPNIISSMFLNRID